MSKTAVVTGASKGIGRETALALAGKGHRVWAIARSEESLRTLQEHHPDHIRVETADLTSTSAIENLTGDMEQALAGESIDILINNAGGLINKTFAELTDADWRSMLDVNLMSAVTLTRSLLPQMNDGGHIVNISSMGGYQGSSKFPGLTAYSVAKGAVSILSECLAAELSGRDIRANALCLGSVQTQMFGEAFPGFEADVQPGAMGTYIADFALNGSTFYNGKVLPVALNDPS